MLNSIFRFKERMITISNNSISNFSLTHTNTLLSLPNIYNIILIGIIQFSSPAFLGCPFHFNQKGFDII